MYGFVRSLRSLVVAAGLLLTSGLAMPPAMAATITYNFTGDVTDVDPLLKLQFNTSQSMSAVATVQTNLTSSSSYEIQSFQVTIGTYTATMGSPGAGNVYVVPASSVSPLPFDFFAVSVNNLSGDAIGSGLLPETFSLQLASTALPNPLSSVALFTDSAATPWRLVFTPGLGLINEVSGILTAVPLPTAVILFGVSLVALIGLGAGGLRHRRTSQA